MLILEIIRDERIEHSLSASEYSVALSLGPFRCAASTKTASRSFRGPQERDDVSILILFEESVLTKDGIYLARFISHPSLRCSIITVSPKMKSESFWRRDFIFSISSFATTNLARGARVVRSQPEAASAGSAPEVHQQHRNIRRRNAGDPTGLPDGAGLEFGELLPCLHAEAGDIVVIEVGV